MKWIALLAVTSLLTGMAAMGALRTSSKRLVGAGWGDRGDVPCCSVTAVGRMGDFWRLRLGFDSDVVSANGGGGRSSGNDATRRVQSEG